MLISSPFNFKENTVRLSAVFTFLMLICLRARLFGMHFVMYVEENRQFLPRSSYSIYFVLLWICGVLSNEVREGNSNCYLQCFNHSLKSTDKYCS